MCIRDSGGHSLKATRLLSKVRSIFRTQLPMSVVFEATTIESLACALVRHEPKPGQTAKIAHVLQRIKSIPSADLKDQLDRKRTLKQSRDEDRVSTGSGSDLVKP